MKPKFLAFPLLALVLSPSVMAGTFDWKGTTDNDWATATNWDTTTAPPSTAGEELTYPAYGTNYTADNLRISNGANPGAVYDPGSALTTTFRNGRGIVIGNSTGNIAGDLTVSSGALAVVIATAASGGGNDVVLANTCNANLLINGGTVDLTGVKQSDNTPRPFNLLFNGGSTDPGYASTVTVSSGLFNCNGINLQNAGSVGAGTINLEGTGVLSARGFTRTMTTGTSTSTLNFNGGTLKAAITNANFIPRTLVNTNIVVKAGTTAIDSNAFDITIGVPVLHDSALGETLDGGLAKNGAGTLTLSGTNTFTGGLTVNAGTALTTFSRLTLDNDSAAGSGTITLADSYAELRLFGTTGRSIANPIVISNTGDEKTLLFTQAGTATCSGPITINETNADHFRVRNDNSALTLSGKISGAGGIHKYAGGATLELTNNTNDFTGGAKITVGTLNFDSGALGTTGSIIMDGGILRWGTGNANDISGRIVMVNAKSASFSTNGNDVNFATAIGNSSTASFVKTTTAGTLTLNGTNSYTGTTTVGGGTLRVNGSLDAASAVSVTGGNLGGTGTIGGSVTVAAAGNLAPGASAGTLTINGDLGISAMAGGAGKLRFELAALAGTNDLITVGGALTLGDLALDDLEITNLGGLEAGTYTLITSTGLSGTVSGATAEIATGFNGQLQISGNNLELVVTAASAGFAAWQSANGTAGGLGEDHDGDGVSNGVEWFLGGNNDTSGFTTPLPGVVGNTVTWVRHPDYPGFPGNYGTDFVVETSTTLVNPWTPATEGVGAGFVEITGNNVKYTFPTGAKNFARLRITGP
jgi:autotransporter-associated beta strand protein